MEGSHVLHVERYTYITEFTSWGHQPHLPATHLSRGLQTWRLCRLTLLYATVYPQCLANSRYSINAGIVTASALSLGVLTTYRYLTLTS